MGNRTSARLAGSALLSGLLGACSGSSTTVSNPVTPAVLVRADDLTRGLGCGAGATQVWKYAAVLVRPGTSPGEADTLVAGGLYDCFADAAFVTPPVPSDAPLALDVYLFNRAAFEGPSFQAQQAAIAAAPSNREALAKASPTWTTRCRATYLPDVVSYASCDAATATRAADGTTSGATVQIELGSLVSAGTGAALACGTAFSGSRATYTVRSSSGTTTGSVPASSCAVNPRIVVSPAEAPATYTFALELLDATSKVVGRTTCGASTSANLTATATCAPVTAAP